MGGTCGAAGAGGPVGDCAAVVGAVALAVRAGVVVVRAGADAVAALACTAHARIIDLSSIC